MKKLLILVSLFAVLLSQQTFSMGYVKKLIDLQAKASTGFLEKCEDGTTVFKFKEISQEQYPYAVAYFDRMRAKYPQALRGVSIMIGNVVVCMSSSFVIIFPQIWIDELQAEIELGQTTQVQNVIEWVLLHEAGHIKKEHLSKLLVATTATNVIIACTIWKSEYFKNFTMFEKFLSYIVAVNVLIFAEKTAYSRYVMEPEADDFANELCDNPEAFDEAANWLERATVDAIHYPTKASRIDKMQQAALKKFCKTEMVTE